MYFSYCACSYCIAWSTSLLWRVALMHAICKCVQGLDLFYSGMHVCVLYVTDVFTDTCRLSFKLESALTARHRERSMSGPSLLSFEALWTASKTRWAGQCVETLANIMNVCTAP